MESLLAGLQSFTETSHILDGALGRALVYLAIALLLGIRLWRDHLKVPVSSLHLRPIAGWSGFTGCLLLLYATLAQLAPPTDNMQLLLPNWQDAYVLLFHTSVGMGWLMFLASLVLAVAFIEHRASWLPILGMLLAVSANSHAGEYGLGSAAFLSDFLHLSAALLWAGGVLVMMGVRLGLDGAVMMNGDRLRRFSRVALPLFLFILASGLGRLLVQYGNTEGFSSLYIAILVLKLAAIAGIMGSAYGLRRQLNADINDERYDNGLSVEVFFLAIMIFVTAMLTQLPTL